MLLVLLLLLGQRGDFDVAREQLCLQHRLGSGLGLGFGMGSGSDEIYL